MRVRPEAAPPVRARAAPSGRTSEYIPGRAANTSSPAKPQLSPLPRLKTPPLSFLPRSVPPFRVFRVFRGLLLLPSVLPFRVFRVFRGQSLQPNATLYTTP